MEKQIILRVDVGTHTAFKTKTASEHLEMSEVLRWAIDDYVSGKWKARPRDRQRGRAKRDK